MEKRKEERIQQYHLANVKLFIVFLHIFVCTRLFTILGLSSLCNLFCLRTAKVSNKLQAYYCYLLTAVIYFVLFFNCMLFLIKKIPDILAVTGVCVGNFSRFWQKV